MPKRKTTAPTASEAAALAGGARVAKKPRVQVKAEPGKGKGKGRVGLEEVSAASASACASASASGSSSSSKAAAPVKVKVEAGVTSKKAKGAASAAASSSASASSAAVPAGLTPEELVGTFAKKAKVQAKIAVCLATAHLSDEAEKEQLADRAVRAITEFSRACVETLTSSKEVREADDNGKAAVDKAKTAALSYGWAERAEAAEATDAALSFAARCKAAVARCKAACEAIVGLRAEGGEIGKIKDALLTRVAVSKICSLLATWRVFDRFLIAMICIALAREVDGYVLRNGLYVRA